MSFEEDLSIENLDISELIGFLETGEIEQIEDDYILQKTQNLTLYIDTDNMDYIEENLGEEGMQVGIKSSNSIWVYFVCKDIDNIRKHKEILKGKRLCENESSALILSNGIQGDKILARCEIRIDSCVDTLDPRYIGKLNKSHSNWIKSRQATPKISEREILIRFMSETDYKSVRRIESVDLSQLKWNMVNSISCITFEVFKTSCIGEIEVVKVIKDRLSK